MDKRDRVQIPSSFEMIMNFPHRAKSGLLDVTPNYSGRKIRRSFNDSRDFNLHELPEHRSMEETVKR